jgi:hypothetical protein
MTITVRVMLGWRADFSDIGGTRVQIRALPSNDIIIGALVKRRDLIQGGFVEVKLSITVPSTLNGQAASVGIFYDGRASQVSVDDVRVTISTA